MNELRYVLAVIPARGGSKGIPRKNVLPIGGKPLIAYTLEDAIAAKSLDCVVVTTDDEEIAAVARSAGVQVVMRPAEYATDEAPIELALRHAVEDVERRGIRVAVVVWLSANNPLRADGVIDAAVQKLFDTGADSVQTVVGYRKPIEWALRLDGDRLFPRDTYEFISRRQDCEPAYHLDGAVVVMRRDNLMRPDDGSLGYPWFYGKDRRAVLHPPEFGVDVDDEFDRLWVEFVLERVLPNRMRQ
jgi:CMP-N,N'-diacetyllegionaminic acid synthase